MVPPGHGQPPLDHSGNSHSGNSHSGNSRPGIGQPGNGQPPLGRPGDRRPVDRTGVSGTEVHAPDVHGTPDAGGPAPPVGVGGLDVDALLEGLTDEQVAAVTADGPVLVEAGPGTGKTRMLVARMALRIADGCLPGRVVAVTFTREAALEIRRRLRRAGLRGPVVCGTFHSLAASVIFDHLRRDRRPVPGILTDRVRAVAAAFDGRPPAPARVLAEAVGRCLAADLTPAALRAGATVPGGGPDPALVADVWVAVRRWCRRRGVVDVDELVGGCARLLERDPRLAEAHRWRFGHIHLDEAQDTTAAQWRLLAAWLGDSDDVFAVGDTDQSIYGFAGADGRPARALAGIVPGLRVVTVATNHRSVPEVVRAAGGVLGHPSRPVARDPGGAVEVVRFADPAAEDAGVVRLVRDLRGPSGSWSSVAVLCRTRAHARHLASVLARRGIPVRSERTSAARLRRLLRATDGTDAATALRAWLADVRAGEPPVPTDVAELAGDVADLLEAMGGSPTVGDLRRWCRTTLGSPPGADRAGRGVAVTTFHAAKGAEWASVVVAGVEEGWVPVAGGNPDEERRLLYVALTRATDRLVVTWTARRDGPRRPSRWMPAPSTPPVPARPPAEIRRFRSRPGSDAPAALRAALRAWRADRARRAGVPPRAVLPDRALERLAVLAPTDEDTIAEVAGLGSVRAPVLAPEIARIIRDHDRPAA